MTTFQAKEEAYLENDAESVFGDQIQQALQNAISRFDSFVRASAALHFLFIGIVLCEIVVLFFFLTFLMQSSLLAVGLAVLFFTFFSYLMFRVFEKASKPEKLREIQEHVLDTCKKLIHYQEDLPEILMGLAGLSCRLSDQFEGREYTYYRPVRGLTYFASFFGKMSFWIHWHDVFRMREGLLQAAIQEHLKMVRCEPTSLDVHAHLANAYVMLSGLYLSLLKKQGAELGSYFAPDHRDLEEKFRNTAQKAIEEFKILLEYAPNDPWVHIQLAYSYHDLNMPLEEIKEYEAILQISPNDHEVLHKLGTLYFQQGMNAKGLRVYEELRHHHYKKAEGLIAFYGGSDSVKEV